jgi:hypothetical protein
MGKVVTGMDPHKRSATIEVMAGDEAVAGGGRYATGAAGYRAMLAEARRWPERTWAAGGCQGIGRHIARRLLAADDTVIVRVERPGGVFAQHGAEGIDERLPQAGPVAARPGRHRNFQPGAPKSVAVGCAALSY